MEQIKVNVYTVQDVSKILQIGRSKAYELFRREDFPAKLVGRQLRVTEVDLIKWLSSQGK
jgi:excisionase family DNA binding protein